MLLSSHEKLRPRRTAAVVAVLTLVASLIAPLAGAVPAQASTNALTITPTEWNVVGLDSNNVLVGPNQYSVGARLCNITTAPVTDITLAWQWNSENAHVNIDGALTKPTFTLAANTCVNRWWTVEVTRNALAYDTTRRFQISASAPDAFTVSTPAAREIYVESLISQNRNSTTSLTGPTNVFVGDLVTYVLDGKTATNGYEQLSAGPTLDGSIFDIVSVAANYDVPTGATNTFYYADACGWDPVIGPAPPRGTYLDCTGPALFAGGKAGGNPILVTVTARVIAAGTGIVSGNIYDYSGSSFHYNSDVSQIVVTSRVPTGSFSLQKSVTDPGNAVPDNTVFTVRYSVNGAASVPVQLTAGAAPLVVSGIPTGATVTFTEDAPPFGGVNWGAPVFSPESASITIGRGTTVPVTVSNPFTLQTGSFSLQKVVTDPDDAVPDATPFTVRYSVNGAAPIAVPLTAGAAPVVVSGIPTGAIVTFSEDAPGFAGVNWGAPVFDPVGASITIGNGTTVPVTVSNPFTPQTGSFSLQKVVTDPGNVVPDATPFTVRYRVNDGAPTVVELIAGDSPLVISGLPTGATVTFTEDAPPFGGVNWGTPIFSPSGASITIGNGTTVPVTVSNPFTVQTGSFSLQKLVTDPTNAVPDDTVFTVNYSVDGAESIPVQLTAGAAPVVVSGLPTGATVTFAEDAPPFGGVNWGTPVFDPVGASITIGNGTTVPVTVSNPFTDQTGSFSLQKLLSGPAAELVPDETTFTVQYSVSGPAGPWVDVVLDSEGTVVPGPTLATGTVVDFREVASSVSGLNLVSSTFHPTSAQITVGNGTTTAVTVTNEFTQKTGTFTVAKVLSGPAGVVPEATEFTVTYSVDGAAPVELTVLADGTPVNGPALPSGSVVSFTELTPPVVAGVNWGSAVFDPVGAEITIVDDTTAAVTVTNEFTPQVGSFSLQKLLDDAGDVVPDDTLFTIRYRVDGATPIAVELTAGADPVVVSGVPTGATVTFTEDAPSFAGVNWSAPVFNPESAQITIGNGTTVPVTVSNPFALQTPSISLVKRVASIDRGADGVLGAGDVITYAFTVTNTGNVALSDVTVTDVLATMSGDPISLAAGASDSTTFAATYVVTPDDVTAGGLENTATAVGSPPWGDDVSDISDAGTDVNGGPVPSPESVETPSPVGGLPNDPRDPTDDPTTVRILPSAADDEDLDNAVGDAVTVDVLANDSAGLVASTVRILTPGTNVPVTSLTVDGEGTWSVNATTGAVTFTPLATFLGSPVPMDYQAANGFGDLVEATVTITYVAATGSFSLVKILDDFSDQVADSTEFIVRYSVDGAPSVAVSLIAGADPVVVSNLPLGAVVEFVEDDPPVIDGVTWQEPTFSPLDATITITHGVTAVSVTNAIDVTTLPPPAISSRAYVDAVPNGTITAGPATIVDRVFYLNLIPEQNYRLSGELVYIENGEIVFTGITGARSFTPTTADGTTEVLFALSEQDLNEMGSKKLFIFLTLFNSAGSEVAFDGAEVATDPWFTSTEEWFMVAPELSLALTGAAPTMGLVAGGVGAVAVGLLLLLAGRRRRTTVRTSAA
jgi:CshA-type fibril repeat protein